MLPRVGDCTIRSAAEKPCQDLVTLVGLALKPFQMLVTLDEAEGYRGMVQYGGPPGWLEESDFVRDGRAVPPAFSVPYRLP
jgi:hypothetical protein